MHRLPHGRPDHVGRTDLDSSWPGYPGGSTGYTDAAVASGATALATWDRSDHDPSFPDPGPATVPTASAVGRRGLSCHAKPAHSRRCSTRISCIGGHSNTPSSVDPGGVDSRHKAPAIAVTEIKGYKFDSLSCLRCHAGTIATPSWINPLKFPLVEHQCAVLLRRGRVLDHIGPPQRERDSPAFDCHPAMNTTMKTWGTDWEQASCTALPQR